MPSKREIHLDNSARKSEEEAKAAIKRRVKCKCTFAQMMVGDGCDVCNPQRAKELAEE